MKIPGQLSAEINIPAYCAVALAGLGNLPDTIMTRSVIIAMRRRAPNESVEPFRDRIQRKEAEPILKAMTRWASSAGTIEFPEMPDGIADRDADVWEPLIAVADLVGGVWPEQARLAAVSLVAASKAKSPSLGVRLLHDIRAAFGDAEQMSTAALLEALNAMEDSPWGDLRGKALDGRKLARMLSEYGVKSTKLRVGVSTANGYRRESFVDAWERYLPPIPRTSGTSGTEQPNPVPHVPDVPFAGGMEEEKELPACKRCWDNGCEWCEKA